MPNGDSVTRLMKPNTPGAVKWERRVASAYSYDPQLTRAFNLSADGIGVYTGTTIYYNRENDQSISYAYAKYGADGQPVWRRGADSSHIDAPDPEPFIYGSLNAVSAGGSNDLDLAGSVDRSTNGRNSDAVP